ncbi:N-acetylmuramoyl-L-alanine amidase [Aquimarina gracilis]|uniref:N-acetylmuramoyl-L-alanine amidase n=1 Tax=Aquimarina gracilis TaxID=874422 RepID=A0ABU5ZPK8_9FLAO|nr:N-acetylmuramoyl-L-alanine amidase [Aquimarina gracilis]MEB3344040.1 N-acetylmuramoyl-L-alanine amidase [Aquimarina gracilis]
MKATSIANHEKTFFETGRDSDGKEFVLTNMTVPIKGTNQVMPYINCKSKNGDTSFFYQEKNTKTQIVLHYTAGYLKGDVAALSKPNNHVSTPFIIARNGKILNLWSSAYWSYHLGSGAIGGNTNGSKRTIAIEMSNIGFLKRIDNKLVTVYSDTDVYCDISEKQFYTKLESPYRGELYYARFTRRQYHSLQLLLRYLTAEYDIPREFLPEEKRYITGAENELVNFKGIVSHVNYRSSGKWDIGPAFDWKKVIENIS